MGNTYNVEIVDTNQTFPCKDTESLLSGMEKAKVRPFPVGCRGGGCGICKIQVIEGEVELGKMSRAHVSVEEEKEGFVLACRATPKSNLKLRTVAASQAAAEEKKDEPAEMTQQVTAEKEVVKVSLFKRLLNNLKK